MSLIPNNGKLWDGSYWDNVWIPGTSSDMYIGTLNGSITNVYADGGILYRPLSQSMPNDDPPKWMKCPHCGVRNRTDQKTVLTCDCCGGNLEANTL